MDELVTVTTYPDTAEALLAKERLELEGVRAFVLDVQGDGVMPFLTASTGGIRVQVEPRDLEKAKEILGLQ
jgi:hypothetical protein